MIKEVETFMLGCLKLCKMSRKGGQENCLDVCTRACVCVLKPLYLENYSTELVKVDAKAKQKRSFH